MKNLCVIIFVVFVSSVNAQKFQASISNTGNTLSFSVKPDVTGTVGFSVVEFYLRYPNSTPVINYGDIIENTTNFPNMGDFSVTNQPDEDGFHVDYFLYTAPEPNTTPIQYTGGVEYEMLTVVMNGVGSTDLQIVHSPGDEDPYYLALTDNVGGDLRPLMETTYFYPTTNSSGDPYFYQISNVPLPVELRKFRALAATSGIDLLWESSNENGFAGYEVQRSTDGLSFSDIAWMPAKGGNAEATYGYTDTDVRPGATYYYRLKMIDNDGRFEYSPIRAAMLEGKDLGLTIYPNPVLSELRLEFEAQDASASRAVVWDNLGRQVLTKDFEVSEGKNVQTLEVGQLSAGVFRVQISVDSKVVSGTFIKNQ